MPYGAGADQTEDAQKRPHRSGEHPERRGDQGDLDRQRADTLAVRVGHNPIRTEFHGAYPHE